MKYNLKIDELQSEINEVIDFLKENSINIQDLHRRGLANGICNKIYFKTTDSKTENLRVEWEEFRMKFKGYRSYTGNTFGYIASTPSMLNFVEVENIEQRSIKVFKERIEYLEGFRKYLKDKDAGII